MHKELIICIVLVILIIIGDIITQNYTKNTVNYLTGELENLGKNLSAKDDNKAYEKISEIDNKWKKAHGILHIIFLPVYPRHRDFRVHRHGYYKRLYQFHANSFHIYFNFSLFQHFVLFYLNFLKRAHPPVYGKPHFQKRHHRHSAASFSQAHITGNKWRQLKLIQQPFACRLF